MFIQVHYISQYRYIQQSVFWAVFDWFEKSLSTLIPSVSIELVPISYKVASIFSDEKTLQLVLCPRVLIFRLGEGIYDKFAKALSDAINIYILLSGVPPFWAGEIYISTFRYNAYFYLFKAL